LTKDQEGDKEIILAKKFVSSGVHVVAISYSPGEDG